MSHDPHRNTLTDSRPFQFLNCFLQISCPWNRKYEIGFEDNLIVVESPGFSSPSFSPGLKLRIKVSNVYSIVLDCARFKEKFKFC